MVFSVSLVLQLFVCTALSGTRVAVPGSTFYSMSASFWDAILNPPFGDHELRTPSPLDLMNGFGSGLSPRRVKRSQESSGSIVSNDLVDTDSSSDVNISNSLDSTCETRSYHSAALANFYSIDLGSYVCQGDINIGSLPMVYMKDNAGGCSPVSLGGQSLFKTILGLRYAVDYVNSDLKILPGIKLGFVQLATCNDDTVALSRSVSFLPRVKVTMSGNDTNECETQDHNGPDSASSISYFTNVTTQDEMPFYDVIGILGPPSSPETMGVSRLMGVAKIPVIGVASTSDDLSNKREHPYYLRIVAPNKHLTEAMLAFAEAHGWSYISVLYQSGSYGDDAFENIKQSAAEKIFCIAYSQRITQGESNLEEVVQGLLSHKKSRVVMTFINPDITKAILNVLDVFNITDHFIWLYGDAWVFYNQMIMKGQEGSFTFLYQSEIVPEFYRAIAKIMLAYRDGLNTSGDVSCACNVGDVDDDCGELNNTQDQSRESTLFNFVMESAWDSVTTCEGDDQDASCVTRSTADETDLLSKMDTTVCKESLYFDAVWTFAMAANQIISDYCPGAKGQEARDCITGPVLLQYLRNTSFNGSSGVVKFDENGDPAGKYVIRQTVTGPTPDPLGLGFKRTSHIGLNGNIVAYYDITTTTIDFAEKEIVWHYFNNISALTAIQEQGLESEHNYQNSNIPLSVCSKPCLPGEFYAYHEPEPCCWTCNACRENERVVNNSCEKCPQFTWPDPNMGFEECVDIPLTYTKISSCLSIVQVVLGTLALLICFMIIGFYIYFRETKVIRASSRELSFLQMIANLVGFVGVILFHLPPFQHSCGALYFLFCLSFAWLYCPLLVKTVRIYRIFESTAKSSRPPRLISPVSQVVMTLALAAVQVILCVYVYIVYKPTAVKYQPVPTAKLVVLSCDFTTPGLTSFLVYNLVLVCLCSIFAFKTRKLPDNYNESQFICVCVTTTLVLWFAFVPAYFASVLEQVRVILLSLALLLNHTVALVFLFAPKVYAVIFLSEDNCPVPRFHRAMQNRSASATMREDNLNKGGSSDGVTDPPKPTTSKLSSNRVSPKVI